MEPADATIMIVDDNAPFRHLMAAFLKKAGFNTIEAANGLEALLLLKTEKINVILLDLQMLPVGGFAFMEEYNELGYKLPVIMITGDQSSDVLERSSKMGFAGVLKKPVTEGRIIQSVERLLT
jgi:DNA-binding NtrC family response regulator